MFWYVTIALIVLLLFWMLVGPVMLQIDTVRQRYRAGLPGVLTARVVPSDGLFFLRFWLFFVPIKIDPFRQRNRRRKKKDRKSVKKKKSRFGIHSTRKILRAIRIKRLELDLDTDDFPLNAWLIPLFSVANTHQNVNMRINFEGVLHLRLDLRTRLITIIWLMITTNKHSY